YGENVRSHKVASFALSERFYPPRFETPKHSHKQALFCFVIEGNYTETYGTHTRECKTSTLLFHPPEELHAEHFHDAGGHSFIVEIDPQWLERVRNNGALPEPSDVLKVGITNPVARRLYKEFVQMDDVSDLIIEGLIIQLIGEAVRNSRKNEASHP